MMAAGNYVLDYSGYKNHGISTTAQSYQINSTLYAKKFDGSANIRIPGSRSMNNLSAFTVEVSILPDGGNKGVIFDKGTRRMIIENSNIHFYLSAGSKDAHWKANVEKKEMDAWIYIALTYDCSSPDHTPAFYANGERLEAQCIQAPVSANIEQWWEMDTGRDMYIGSRDDGSEGFYGLIGDFRLYNRILTDDELYRNLEIET
jgi:hypothetical protein